MVHYKPIDTSPRFSNCAMRCSSRRISSISSFIEHRINSGIAEPGTVSSLASASESYLRRIIRYETSS